MNNECRLRRQVSGVTSQARREFKRPGGPMTPRPLDTTFSSGYTLSNMYATRFSNPDATLDQNNVMLASCILKEERMGKNLARISIPAPRAAVRQRLSQRPDDVVGH